jgi:(p)ppGpp synthase/HD superfamily hydrolase
MSVCSQCRDVSTFCKCFEKVVEEHEEGLINKAKELATLHHKGQTDKAGKPYIQHPLRLMEAVNSTNEKIVAVLHDIVEDTDVSFDDLKAEGFNETIVGAIKCVTKIDGENYEIFSQ